MKKIILTLRRLAIPLLAVAMFLLVQWWNAQPQQQAAAAPSYPQSAVQSMGQSEATAPTLDKDGTYTAKEDVALYLALYQTLPQNFITKRQAEALGWDSRAGNLRKVAPGKSIGGDFFGNYEGSLPEQKGRTWKECDIDTNGGHRGAKRIVFSSDGLIYYTQDHYDTFVQLTPLA